MAMARSLTGNKAKNPTRNLQLCPLPFEKSILLSKSVEDFTGIAEEVASEAVHKGA